MREIFIKRENRLFSGLKLQCNSMLNIEFQFIFLLNLQRTQDYLY